MKTIVLGLGIFGSVVSFGCPTRCLAGLVALVGLTIAGCTNDNAPAPGPYYTPNSSSSYSSTYETHTETRDGKTTSRFSGEITQDGKTQKYDNPLEFNRDNPEPRFAPNRFAPPLSPDQQ